MNTTLRFTIDKETLNAYAAMRNAQGVRCDDTLCALFSYKGAGQGIFDNAVTAEPQKYHCYTENEWIDANTENLRLMRDMFLEHAENNKKMLFYVVNDRLQMFVVDYIPSKIERVPFLFKQTTQDMIDAFLANNMQEKDNMVFVSDFTNIIETLEKLIENKVQRCKTYLKKYRDRVCLED